MTPRAIIPTLTAVTLAVTLQSSLMTAGSSTAAFLPGQRVLLDAHNAYPDRGRFHERIDDALATGLPVAIEQDLAWCRGSDGAMAPVVSHETTRSRPAAASSTS